MPPPTWAYQVDNFNPPPDEELVCSICQAVFCDPVQSPCNHVFCRNCINRWLESNRNCPICRKRTTRSTLQEVVPLIKNMIMKLNLRCHNVERGCLEVFTLENCDSHIEKCPYEMVQCKNKPCKMMFMKSEIKDHELNNCLHSCIKCKKCNLKISAPNNKNHNCIKELQKKLKEKSEKLKKNQQKIKKLKDEIKILRQSEDYTSLSDSSAVSLSPTEILFSFNENSNLSGLSSNASSSLESDSADDDFLWPESVVTRQGMIDELEQLQGRINSHFQQISTAPPNSDSSIEIPRTSTPSRDDSSVVVVEPAEETIDDEPEIRRSAKRRLNANVLNSTDEDDKDLEADFLPSRKRTWQIFQTSRDNSATAQINVLGAAGPSYQSSTGDSSTSTYDSSPANSRNKPKPKSKLRVRSEQQSSASNDTSSQNANPVFERTISLLERYNLESDPEWLPHEESLVPSYFSDSDDLSRHITISDESSISELDSSESSYEDAADGRTKDLLNSFYGSSDSDSDE